MSKLGDALRTFSKYYHEAAPVSQGDCHDESLSEAPGEYFPTGGGGDASGKMVYKGGRKGDGPRGLRDTGKTRAPEAEGDDSRRGTWPGSSIGAGDGEPDDPMSPGWRGPALDEENGDDDGTGEEARMAERGSKVNIRCPHCAEPNRVRLPAHLTVVRSAQTGEAKTSEGRVLRTKCGSCGEAVRFHAPEGHAFVTRTGEAARHFRSRYLYLTGRGGSITRGLRSAREAFRRSYFNR